MYLIFDTETTGLPKNFNAPITDLDNWPRVVQIAWQLHDEKGKLLSQYSLIIKPEGFTIPYNAEKVHGISTDRALKEGHPLKEVLQKFSDDLAKAKRIVGHNIDFDVNILGAEFLRLSWETPLPDLPKHDTMREATDYCQLAGGKIGSYKPPKLIELHQKLFGEGFGDAHDAAYDVSATARSFFELIKVGVILPMDNVKVMDILYEAPVLKGGNFKAKEEKKTITPSKIDTSANLARLKDVPFSHLHCHSQFSVLSATAGVKELIAKAKEWNMPAVALTDLGNMYGAFIFVKEALDKGIKPILGCEFYIAQDRTVQKFTKDAPDRRFNQVLIAKNKEGYHNLAKLSSEAFISGYYAGFPRIDKPLLLQYKSNLIATTGGLESEIPNLILNQGEEQAEEAFVWWKTQFGEDFYVQLMRHNLEEENRVNEVLLKFCQKYQVKYFAANNVYYMDKKGAEAHDILLCVRDGEKKDTPIGRGRGHRFGFPNNEFYFKSPEEMKTLFADLPEAIETTNEIISKIESYKLARNVLLPKFDIPKEFINPEDEKDGGKRGENAYLRHLTFEGAKRRYGTISPDIQERLDFELMIIEKTGYPGYFLIVQDFTSAARNMGVSVGPGRGSAAGSAVAYCIGITNVDPIKYGLLFERFLNPDRVSLPDIDIDFDDAGRDKIIDWVIQKYGQNQVAQIITYGTMAGKSSIRDAARVLDLPLQEADRVAKLVPSTVKLKKALKMNEEEMREELKPDELPNVQQLKSIEKGSDAVAQTLKQAVVLEGSLRNTGTHACGVIITPDDITKLVPVATAKDSSLLVTQFDNSVVESAGMLKMDFLGLTTLTIINEARRMIKARHGIDIDPDNIPLDDKKTFELYQRGDTNGTFQFESPGMQKHLRNLKPDNFEDLVAMNALYRPGPLAYIPNFINRKHGVEPITYDLKEMEEYLKDTYGITVYQEQVMRLSQKLANFTKGDADVLRKAMGKKQKDVLDKMKSKFMEGAQKNGHPAEKLEKIWTDWEAFAQYAFNRSHSVCYAVVAFHTAYFKAHYPAEYMAAVLTNNMNDIKSITFFMEECKHINVSVLPPDINESEYTFSVNKAGAIRFGLGAIKGVGEASIEAIIEERKANGAYTDIWDFLERVNAKNLNKRVIEGLAQGGALDRFEFHRAQYFHVTEGTSGAEKLLKFANNQQNAKSSSQVSLFGAGGKNASANLGKTKLPECDKWTEIVQLKQEKEVVGFFLSGHPLDEFKTEIQSFCKPISQVQEFRNQEITVAGILNSFQIRQSQKGNEFAIIELEDYEGTSSMMLFGEAFNQAKPFLAAGNSIALKGKVKEKRNALGEWELFPDSVFLLSDLKKQVKQVKLEVEATRLNPQLLQELEEVIASHTGKCALRIEIFADTQEFGKVIIPMQSRKFKVEPNLHFMKEMERLEVLCKVG
jgi:DNA polymerase-3 subunit alpha